MTAGHFREMISVGGAQGGPLHSAIKILFSRESGVGGLSGIVFRPVANEGLHPFDETAPQPATGLAFAFLARTTGADGAVMQGLAGRNIIRHAEDQEAVVHEHNLQRQTR